MNIPAELEQKIDEVISHYPVSKRSASLPLLHLAQEHFGYISDEAIEWIAQKLGLQPIHILELVTFYPMFRRQPAGKYHIRVCRTLSCAMAGGYQLMEDFCKLTHIDRKSPHASLAPASAIPSDEHHDARDQGHGSSVSVSPDGKYSIEFVECLASCGSGPVCMINDDFYENVHSQEVASQILDKYQD